MAGVLKALDPVSGEWVPISERGPQGIQGPLGPTGPQGIEQDEVYVGATLPTGPQTDIWYDIDAPDPPPQSLAPYAPLAIKVVNSFAGPWDNEGSADTIINGLIPGQQYLVMASCSSLATANGMKYVDVAVDGTNILPLGLYFNQINIHMTYPMMATAWRATLESHTFGFRSGSGTPVGDANDKASLIIIPCAG